MYEGPCPIALSATQNNCWWVAKSNLEKNIHINSSTQKYRTPSKTAK